MRSTFDQTFNINTITIHTVEGASCINIGNNFPAGFESYKKHTQGFGSISGNDNTIDGLRSLLHDHSLVDTFSGSDLYNSPWIKELMETKMKEVLESDEVFDASWLKDDEDSETDTDPEIVVEEDMESEEMTINPDDVLNDMEKFYEDEEE